MLSVPVRKDISEYKSKIFGKLTARTIITALTAVTLAIVVACVLQFILHVDWMFTQWFVYIIAFAVFGIGFYRPLGLAMEDFIPLWVRHKLTDDRCLYVSTTNICRKDQERGIEQISVAYSSFKKIPGIEAFDASAVRNVQADG